MMAARIIGDSSNFPGEASVDFVISATKLWPVLYDRVRHADVSVEWRGQG